MQSSERKIYLSFATYNAVVVRKKNVCIIIQTVLKKKQSSYALKGERENAKQLP